MFKINNFFINIQSSEWLANKFKMFTLLNFSTWMLLLVFINSAYALEKFTIDPQHSYVLWRVQHLGFSNQSGKWYVNGHLLLDKDHPQNSQISAKIKISDMITGIPKLDNHLQSAEFFDVAKYPDATFSSTKVDVLSQNQAKIYGTLTLHGVSKPIVLDVMLNKVGMSPVSKKMTAGFSGHAMIKRSDFNIKAFLPAVADDVELTLEVEANLNDPKDLTQSVDVNQNPSNKVKN